MRYRRPNIQHRPTPEMFQLTDTELIGEFTPPSVEGITGWWKSDDTAKMQNLVGTEPTDGQAIKRWDSSFGGQIFQSAGTNSTSPKWIAGAFETHPAVRFNSAFRTEMMATPGGYANQNTGSLLCVFRLLEVPTDFLYRGIFAGRNRTQSILINTNFPVGFSLFNNQGRLDTAFAANTDVHVFVARYNVGGLPSDFVVPGKGKGGGTLNPNTFALLDPWEIGHYPQSTTYTRVEYFEIARWARYLTNSEQSMVAKYAAAKYAARAKEDAIAAATGVLASTSLLASSELPSSLAA